MLFVSQLSGAKQRDEMNLLLCYEQQTYNEDGYDDVVTAYDYVTNLRDHALERLHNPGTFGFLVVRETSGYDHDGCQHDTQVQLNSIKLLR